MTALSPATLADLRRLLDAAAAGPWHVEGSIYEGMAACVVAPDGQSESEFQGKTLLHSWELPEASLIVALRNHAAALLDAAERLAAAEKVVEALCPSLRIEIEDAADTDTRWEAVHAALQAYDAARAQEDGE